MAEELQLAQFNETHEINWRITALKFEGGKDVPFPKRITRESLTGTEQVPVSREPLTLEELIPPHVRALLQGV